MLDRPVAQKHIKQRETKHHRDNFIYPQKSQCMRILHLLSTLKAQISGTANLKIA